LTLRKIIEIVATRCHILKLKCTKFAFHWDPHKTSLGELIALPRPLAGFRGLFLKEGREGRTGGYGKGRGEGRRRESGQMFGFLLQNSFISLRAGDLYPTGFLSKSYLQNSAYLILRSNFMKYKTAF